MLAQTVISPIHWAGFIVAVLIFLALDLGVFHRRAHTVKFGEALTWTIVWFTTAMLFAFLFVRPKMGHEFALLFVTGYITELSLSMDNVFVIALIFSYFRIPDQYQHRVLFWGILGALVMRGIMISVGAALVQRFEWILYIFGVFLVYTGIKMLFAAEGGVHPEKNPVIRVARRFYPVSTELEGQKFFTTLNGKSALTPLALVLLMVETTDLIFAVDSIPAIFVFTTNTFIVFTSNVFAILGLRSLYFVLANAIGYFRYLKVGLSIVLIFIGGKMLLDFKFHIPVQISLAIVTAIIFTSIATSLIVGWTEKREKSK